MFSSSKSNNSINSNSSRSNSSMYDDNDDNDTDDDDRDEEDNGVANCIRNRSNFSIVKSFHMIDKKDFNPELLKIYIENNASPKLKLLLKKIEALDAKDMRTSGKKYKHLIFTDVNRSAYGAKIIASALASYGMNMIYHPQGTGFSIHDNDKLLQTKGSNFAVLLSKAFYDRPVNVKVRKAILEKFNSRPDNIYGDLIRFIILDQGFKEGIDLFDVKYVHLFEPLLVPADQKQAIGRATRFCGQKGLEFHPRYGWPLYVYKYDVSIPDELKRKYMDSKTLFDYYIKHSNLDMRKIIFASELENATINAAVDHDLTRAIHTFSIEKPPPMLSSSDESRSRSRSRSRSASPIKIKRADPSKSYSPVRKNIPFKDEYKNKSIGGIGRKNYVKKAPPKILNLQKMRQFIASKFMRIRYPRVQLENQCKGGNNGWKGGNNGNIVTFTPTQEFVRLYFQPESAYKGILLHHSVGTGKTCTAIATATTSFDVEGYTILWVTRHTLKADIWKNMYGQVCSLHVQEQIKDGLKLPNKIGNKFKYISDNWLEPISYKQFSNMLLKKNKIYNEMVKRNGAEDPLKKTLLIIDEAHKLYSPTVAKSEKPDTDILEKMIQNSYNKSKKDSVRVMLMTATPFTEDGMEMIKLLNLLRQGQQFPTEFKKFGEIYLNDEGYFTKKGLKAFQDNISGYISYLNRSQDARNFAHPVLENVYAKLSVEPSPEDMKQKPDQIPKDLREHMKEVRAEMKELKAQHKGIKKRDNGKGAERMKKCKDDAMRAFDAQKQALDAEKKAGEDKCKALPVKERKGCKETLVNKFKDLMEKLKLQKAEAIERCKELKNMPSSNSQFAKLNARMHELDKEINEYKKKQAVVKEIKAKNKGVRGQVKELNAKKKLIQARKKAVQAELKTKKALMKKKMEAIKKIKDKNAKKVALKEFRATALPAEIKELTKEYKDLKAQASKLNSQANVMKMANGMKALKNISQDYALGKYCVPKSSKGKNSSS